MDQTPHYPLQNAEDWLTMEFVSSGPRGDIHKVIQFQRLPTPEPIYNVAFGDKNPETGIPDDKVVTDNADTLQVLATVALAAFLFTEQFPNVYLYVEGSTEARTRLYRRSITLHEATIFRHFDVYGLKDDSWESFASGQKFSAFLFRRKL
jgi:hypothetical protein